MREWLNKNYQENESLDGLESLGGQRNIGDGVFAIFKHHEVLNAYHCPFCNWEGYFHALETTLLLSNESDSYISSRKAFIDEFNSRSKRTYQRYKAWQEKHEPTASAEFYKRGICPCCGGKISLEQGLYTSKRRETNRYDDKLTYNVNDVYEEMRKLRDECRTEEVQGKFAEIVRQSDLPVACSANTVKIEEIKSTPEKLKQYVQELLKLESAIHLEKERIEQLFHMQADVCNGEIRDKYLSKALRENLAEAEEKAVTEAEAAYKKCKELQESLRGDPKPVTFKKPKRPHEPVYRKPNIFNRKRVEQENLALLEQHKIAVAQWEAEVQKVEKLEAEQNLQIREKREQDRKAAADKVKIAQENIEKAKRTLDEKKKEAECSAVGSKVESYRSEAVENELAQAKKTLQELCKCRNELYACNIIFPKYRGLVELSVICEYLMTGRCSALEGADGAYNLYESELRANLIIAELAVVIESLEQIKKNQFMLYNELQTINANLDSMHSTMVKMHKTLENIEGNTEAIAKNSAVIAHNTAVAAHYAKVNAELTDALGFMMALR